MDQERSHNRLKIMLDQRYTVTQVILAMPGII